MVGLIIGSSCGGGGQSPGPSEGGGSGVDGGGGSEAAGPPSEASAGDGAGDDAGASVDAGGQDAHEGGPGNDGGAFAVGQLPGLALWLDAAKGITLHTANYVRDWADQSKNHNDGVAGEPHPVEEPTLIASSINSLPALHFEPGTYTVPNCDGEDCGAGTNIMINDSPSLQWGTDDFLVEVVGRYTNSDPQSPEYTYAGTFFFRSATNGPWLRGNSCPAAPSTGLSALLSSKEGGDVNELVTTTTGYNDGTARLMAMQRVGTVFTIRLNGKVVATKTFSSVLDVTGDITGDSDGSDPILVTVGASYSDVSRLAGDIAEVIAVRGPLSAEDLAGIEGYLLSKYAL